MNTPVIMPSSTTGTIVKVVGGLVAAGAAYYFYNDWRKKQDIKEVENKLQNSPAGQQAQQLRAAFNPSGSSWLIGMDFTNTTAVMRIASQIQNFADVQDSYRKLYNANLSEDLVNELSSSELTQFYRAMKMASPEMQKYLPKFKTGQTITNKVPNAILYTFDKQVLKTVLRLPKDISLKVLDKNIIVQIGKTKDLLIKVQHKNGVYYIKQRMVL